MSDNRGLPRGWEWMEGHTLLNLHPERGYIARAFFDDPGGTYRHPRPSPRPSVHAVRRTRGWEIEGYGPTPADAEYGLLIRLAVR